MVLKRDFVRRLNKAIVISMSLFIVFIGVYFYMSFISEVNAVNSTLTTIQGLITNNANLIGSARNGLTQARFLFTAELITFVIASFSLLGIIWFTTQKYMVQKRNALIDPLTQLYNRKAFFFALKQELKKTERFHHPTTVAIMDIDFFKKYNDRNGHVAGDKLLQRFSRILEENVREYDTIGRYGGEEFVILFPETEIKEAAKVCERIRKEVEETNFYGQQKMPFKKITVSIGLSEIKGKKRIKRETLIRKADEQLYKAKESGRNQVLFEKQ